MINDTMDPHRWVQTLATALDVPTPSQAEIDDLLALAGDAAHASQRWAAPISTYLAAQAGLSTADARALVKRLADAAAGPITEPDA
ncbi:MAG: hypothetical protein ACI970_000861 [Myxococcota bacterium]